MEVIIIPLEMAVAIFQISGLFLTLSFAMIAIPTALGNKQNKAVKKHKKELALHAAGFLFPTIIIAISIIFGTYEYQPDTGRFVIASDNVLYLGLLLW